LAKPHQNSLSRGSFFHILYNNRQLLLPLVAIGHNGNNEKKTESLNHEANQEWLRQGIMSET
jgi:hypothetical protein